MAKLIIELYYLEEAFQYFPEVVKKVSILDENSYMSLPHDLSGSVSKNRFRNEMLWGLSLIFESYIAEKDFVAVFDYVCDIELHSDGGFSFFQLKTSSGTSPYTTTKLTKVQEADGETHSIIGKLFLIKNALTNDSINCKIAVVSNVPIRLNGVTYTRHPEICIGIAEQNELEKLTTCLKKEFPDINAFDFSSIFYILSSIDLFNPRETLIGQTVNFYRRVTGNELSKPETLYRALSDAISNCACYELEVHSYEDLVSHKGITRKQIDNILAQYSTKANDSVLKCKEYLDSLYHDDFAGSVAAKKALNQITIDLHTNKLLQYKEQEIQLWLTHHVESFHKTKIDTVNYLIGLKIFDFPLEYTSTQILVFLLLILTRIEEGVYEISDSK